VTHKGELTWARATGTRAFDSEAKSRYPGRCFATLFGVVCGGGKEKEKHLESGEACTFVSALAVVIGGLRGCIQYTLLPATVIGQ
jgi:hypothetical protein